MSIQKISTKVISTLGNKESLLPIMLKDGVDSASLTYKSYKAGGVIEGIDRGIDEFGTQAIWIGGIPFFKFLIDKSIYKLAKINPAVDPRVISDKEYSKWALDNAKGIMSNDKTQSVKEAISKCLKDGGKAAKSLYIAKVALSTVLTLGAYFLLTKLKQKNTKNNILKEMNNNVASCNNHSKIFDDIAEFKSKSPSFKGIAGNIINGVMYNPVHNMKIIDAGITSERLLCSRNATEFCEHAIKEGGFLFFIYGFGNLIEKGINKISSAVFKTPIDLPIDVLTDESYKKALQGGSIIKELESLPAGKLTDKLNFIINNPDNILVKSAKKSKIISTVKDASGNTHTDTSKFIDMKKLEELAENLKTAQKKFEISGISAEKYVKKAKGLKILSVMANIGISCLFLGVIIPKLIYLYREKKTGTTKFHVEENMKNKA